MHCPEEPEINTILDVAGLKTHIYVLVYLFAQQYSVHLHTCQDY